MAGLAILKHTYDLSDEVLCERWVENPYYQYFCGEYQSLQAALSWWTAEYIHPRVPWLLSYLNGSSATGFALANLYRHPPGRSGPMKEFDAGVLGWLAMDLILTRLRRNLT